MTKENLLKGQEILEELEKLSHTQDIWNNASKISLLSLIQRLTRILCSLLTRSIEMLASDEPIATLYQ